MLLLPSHAILHKYKTKFTQLTTKTNTHVSSFVYLFLLHRFICAINHINTTRYHNTFPLFLHTCACSLNRYPQQYQSINILASYSILIRKYKNYVKINNILETKRFEYASCFTITPPCDQIILKRLIISILPQNCISVSKVFLKVLHYYKKTWYLFYEVHRIVSSCVLNPFY